MSINIGGQEVGQQGQQSAPVASAKPRKDKLKLEDLYAYYDRGKKSIADFVSQYQNVSNYDYYKNTRGTIDYRYKLQDLYDYARNRISYEWNKIGYEWKR